mmetsp:Transcript_36607/g.74602  ORF Transcript_36607/g.74602 Transcript_36607/m.74602 type:complete len:1237 (-) Transcript_36607:129-3839(-)
MVPDTSLLDDDDDGDHDDSEHDDGVSSAAAAAGLGYRKPENGTIIGAALGAIGDLTLRGLPAPPLTAHDETTAVITTTATAATAASTADDATAKSVRDATDLVAALSFGIAPGGGGGSGDPRIISSSDSTKRDMDGTDMNFPASPAPIPSVTPTGTPQRGNAIPIPIQPAVTATPPKVPSYHRLNSAPAGIHPTTVQITDTGIGSSDAVGNINSTTVAAGLTTLTPSQLPQPADYIDPNDRHIWRAKFCVLEDGVLYFYRNEQDGNSIEAQIEREQTSLFQHQQPLADGSIHRQQQQQHQQQQQQQLEELSKSPGPRKFRPLLDSHDHAGATSFCYDGNVIWEKRVSLDHVGEVRSAEMEYGPNSFELLAVGYEDNLNALNNSVRAGEGCTGISAGQSSDRLILRAGSKEEMNEWLFQFHRSLASFMKQIVNMVGSNVPGVGDLHLRADQYHPDADHMIPPLSSSQRRAVAIPMLQPPPQKTKNESSFAQAQSYSPGSQLSAMLFPESALSHGHGRSGMHRRRIRTRQASDYTGRKEIASPLSTPGGGASPDTLSVGGSWVASSASVGRVAKKGVASSLDSRASTEGSGSSLLGSPLSGGNLEIIPPKVHRIRVPSPVEKNQGQAAAAVRGFPPASSGKYVPPHLRPTKASAASKYIPPHLRNKDSKQTLNPVKLPSFDDDASSNGASNGVFGLADEEEYHSAAGGMNRSDGFGITSSTDECTNGIAPGNRSRTQSEVESCHFMMGGCADPTVAIGSIEDEMYVPKKASRIGRFHTKGHGGRGGQSFDSGNSGDDSDAVNPGTALQWEVGAVSECGVRESNEDAYIISHDLSVAFDEWREHHGEKSILSDVQHYGLFAIFDGHCGNHAARYACEKLPALLFDEYKHLSVHDDATTLHQHTERMLTRAIQRLDEAFCLLCYADGREWESGATALVVLIVDDLVTVANLGDSRGVVCMSKAHHHDVDMDEWALLEENDTGRPDMDTDDADAAVSRRVCLWKEVTDVHSPDRDDERERVENANGWVTTETEIPISQLQRIDFLDADVVEILRRCFSDRFDDDPSADVHRAGKKCSAEPGRLLQISRVCGELAVSRAIGDRDFKAAYNEDMQANVDSGSTVDDTTRSSPGDDSMGWESPLFLPYPEDHSRRFEGDLVSGVPEFQHHRAGLDGHINEFLLLACDGLWDVMDADDAVRVARGLLFDKGWSAQKAAARLAELAKHLGSSDNITVIVIRFFTDT